MNRNMNYYFYPTNEKSFKQSAIGKFVRTLVYNKTTNEIEFSFVRSVKTEWKQSCKNNIETDHRIKALAGQGFEIYSWVVNSKSSLDLPKFIEFSQL